MKKLVLWIIIGVMIFLTACGSKETPTPEPSPTTAPTEVPPTAKVAPTDTPPPPTEAPTPTVETGAVTSLDGVQQATIQIEAQGTFVDPAGEQTSVAGRGSGFIIDPSGIAVTNNHVVVGAALLKVWIGGESQTYNAKILGVSECSDLAVIDLEGDDFPYLAWYEGDINPGLDVYAAGFPLGEPEYTLTRGIVSKAQTRGETNWASVDAVLQHDATINPGNSGGPLVTADGQVAGVNYRSRPEANQYFAIAPAEALPIIEKLRAGQNVDAIGVNAEAVTYESGLSGIWAASVQSGSPADQAGLKSGDIIVELEGLELASEGTLETYCDILRTHNPAEDTLNIRVVRFATQEVWEGQLNGRELALSFSFAQEASDDLEAAEEGETYTNYVRVEDDYGAIKMEVPEEWDDVDGSPWTNDDGEVTGSKLTASPSGEGDNPFVYFGAMPLSETFDPDELLDTADFSDLCEEYGGRSDYEDQLYTGKYDYYTSCGDADSVIFVVVAAPEDQAYLTLVMIQAISKADLEAADHIFDTFEVIDELPGEGTGEGATDEGGATLEITNEADETIAAVYISPSDSDSWGEDWLEGAVINPGETYMISGIPSGVYDIRPTNDADEGLGTLYSVELTDEHTWTVQGMASLPDNAEVRFSDDFSDNRNNWGAAGEGEYADYIPPTDGEFCILIKDTQRLVWEWYEPFRTDEFFAEVKCTLDNTDGDCGLGFGPDGDNLYWFNVHPALQEFSLQLLQDDAWQDDLVERTTSNYISPDGVNYLALGRVDNIVSVYVNGTLIGRVENDLFPTGRVGIGGATYDDPNITVCLDDLTVWQLE